MENIIDDLLTRIETQYEEKIKKGGRHYMEVSLSRKAMELGFDDLDECYRNASAIVPLKGPQSGMKVRIDGRAFVNYAEYESGIAVPGYLAKTTDRNFRTYVPQDSMICNFC